MEKIIPKKNYVIMFLLVVLVICACFAFINLYNIYHDGNLGESPLKTNEVLYDDLKNAIIDINADTFLVISYTGERNVYNNEKQILKVLEKNNLVDNVMYLDITDKKEDNNFNKEINKVLKLENKVEKFPALVFYQENKPVMVIDSKEHILNKDDFQSIIDKYDLAG